MRSTLVGCAHNAFRGHHHETSQPAISLSGCRWRSFYPSRTDRCVVANCENCQNCVPYPAGGTADILARILGEQISRTEGVTLLTENRPGASAVIGTEAVSRAAPDGSTLLITSTAFLIAPHLRKLNYDPLTSFEPICQLVSTPIIVVVNSESPYRTFADWLNAA